MADCVAGRSEFAFFGETIAGVRCGVAWVGWDVDDLGLVSGCGIFCNLVSLTARVASVLGAWSRRSSFG
jgi:hypothetical protein